MRRLFVALALVSSSALATASNPADVIATRSGLPASEVDAALSHCNANQTSMNLCAWRDQIVAEQKLERVVEGKAAVSPTCKAAIEKRITAWKRRRDANCEKSASREWGGGSMLPTAVAMCKTAETERMSKAIQTAGCR
ncbi:lysozyme inhibitor LprI family protein [Paraburkholderia atlantica]|uniref:lysozyme inhibitor LprI family protein n=1 Tax=Paraburkholderia atlantica TaxID=2654982 RepID=UPI00059F9A26|nr:lysozyme inhibitor LprI family protein [Paraburkholderia atlantica]